MLEIVQTIVTVAAPLQVEAIAGEGGSLKIWAYVAFLGMVLVFLALDLGVFHREAHEVGLREATIWSAVWLSCGVAFAGVVYGAYEHHWLGLGLKTPAYNPDPGPGEAAIILTEVGGKDAATQYLTGYVVEKSLAMDNIFVIALVFTYFAIPSKYQHRVLFWGILGALLMRGGMIFLGAELVVRYTWVLIVFGGFLILTAIKMAFIKSNDDPGANIVVRLVRRLLPVTPFLDGEHFLTRRTVPPTYSPDPATGKLVRDPAPEGTLRRGWAATPLLLALVMVEVTDVVFAVDSIPAIFAITPDPFIVLTSNVFAMLGLRSLYFCLAALLPKFTMLKPALILILAFVGVKLLLLAGPPYVHTLAGKVGFTMQPLHPIKISTSISMGVVLGLLAAAVAGSWLLSRRKSKMQEPAR